MKKYFLKDNNQEVKKGQELLISIPMNVPGITGTLKILFDDLTEKFLLENRFIRVEEIEKPSTATTHDIIICCISKHWDIIKNLYESSSFEGDFYVINILHKALKKGHKNNDLCWSLQVDLKNQWHAVSTMNSYFPLFTSEDAIAVIKMLKILNNLFESSNGK